MPYKSQNQAAFFNIHRKQLEKKGVDVDEWNASSKGMDLPVKAAPLEKEKVIRHPGALKRAAKRVAKTQNG